MVKIDGEHYFGYAETLLEACSIATASSTDTVFKIIGVW